MSSETDVHDRFDPAFQPTPYRLQTPAPGLLFTYFRTITKMTPFGPCQVQIDWPIVSLQPSSPPLPLHFLVTKPSSIFLSDLDVRLGSAAGTPPNRNRHLCWVPVIVLGVCELQWLKRDTLQPYTGPRAQERQGMGVPQRGTDTSAQNVLARIAWQDADAIAAGTWNIDVFLHSLATRGREVSET
jgi:hypothetical protein